MTKKEITTEIELRIKEGVELVMQTLKISHFPTLTEFREVQIKGLESLIHKTGGTEYWRLFLNLPKKPKKDTAMIEKLIEKNIKDCMASLNIDRMPTTAEIKSYDSGKNIITNRISKNGGFNYWANKLNLVQKESEYLNGYRAEEKVKTALEEMGYEANLTSVKHPYDIVVNADIRIDVKSATASTPKRTGVRCYTFGGIKPSPVCDLYILVALSETGVEESLYVVPSHEVKIQTLEISATKSKYDIYKDRWDLVKKYDDFYKSFK